MERLFSQSIGIPVIADDLKAPVGFVKDFIINTENGKIMAFIINKKQNLVVSEQDISGFEFFPRIKTVDAMIEGKEIVRVYDVQKKGLFIVKNRVFTENGKYLGICEDFSYDDNSFQLKKLFVSRRFLHFFKLDERIIAIEEIVVVKRNKIVVKDDLLAEKQRSMATAN